MSANWRHRRFSVRIGRTVTSPFIEQSALPRKQRAVLFGRGESDKIRFTTGRRNGFAGKI